MDWLSGITAFDVLALLIFLVFLVRGIWIGFIRQISSLVALIGGFVLAGYFDNEFYGLLLPYIENSQIAFLITYFLLVVVFFLLIKLAGVGLKKVMDVTLTSWFDRTVGGAFGFLKGVFVVTLIFVFVSSYMSGANNYLKQSVSYPIWTYSAEMILTFIKDYDLRSYFVPKEPAIKLPFSNKSSTGNKTAGPKPGTSGEDSKPSETGGKVSL